MKPTSPWSVKGVDPEAREAAKLAARRAGVPLGIWLSGTIRKAAVEELKFGAPPPDAQQYARPDPGYGPDRSPAGGGYSGAEQGGYGSGYGHGTAPDPQEQPSGYGQEDGGDRREPTYGRGYGYGQRPGHGTASGHDGYERSQQQPPRDSRPARPPAPTTEAVLESINRLATKIEENESRTAEAIAPIADRVRKLTDQIEDVKERQALESNPLERALMRMQERLDEIEGGGSGHSRAPRERKRSGGFFSRLFSDY